LDVGHGLLLKDHKVTSQEQVLGAGCGRGVGLGLAKPTNKRRKCASHSLASVPKGSLQGERGVIASDLQDEQLCQVVTSKGGNGVWGGRSTQKIQVGVAPDLETTTRRNEILKKRTPMRSRENKEQ